ASNDRGVIINRVIELERAGATILYWFLAAVSASFVLLAAFFLYHRLTYRQRLAFGSDALAAPVALLSRRERQSIYEEVWDWATATIEAGRVLYITHPGGRYTIEASMLRSDAEFEEVCELLAAKVQGARSAARR